MNLVYTIKKEDIGKNMLDIRGNCKECGRKYPVIYLSYIMGRILICDIGKRIYEKNNTYYVENNRQLKKRQQNESH